MTNDKVLEILPCPFCGSKNIRFDCYHRTGSPTGEVWSMCCYDCGAMFPNRFVKSLLIDCWNNRVSIQAAAIEAECSNELEAVKADYKQQVRVSQHLTSLLESEDPELAAAQAHNSILLDALVNLWAQGCGGEKTCGHNYPCVCVEDKVRKALAITISTNALDEAIAKAIEPYKRNLLACRPSVKFYINHLDRMLLKKDLSCRELAEQVLKNEVVLLAIIDESIRAHNAAPQPDDE